MVEVGSGANVGADVDVWMGIFVAVAGGDTNLVGAGDPIPVCGLNGHVCNVTGNC